ncbi:MAG: type VII secretion protein EccCa, partial [Nocardioides sp.]|nr:type VII secretion protein EccCa [Nocardioides sp.]
MTTTLVRRPARIAPPRADRDPIKIVPPPGRGEMPQAIAGAGMLMMPLAGGTGALTMAVTQRDRPVVVVGSFLMLLAMISIGVIMVVSQRSGNKRKMRESRERYLDYIESFRHDVRSRISDQRAEMAWRFPRTDQLLDICINDRRRWERRLSHSDFLVVRLGTGEVPLGAGLTLDADTGPLNEFDPVCLQAAQELQQRYSMLHDQPVELALGRVGQLSMLGAPGTRREVATSIALQLATLHSPNDVSIAVVRSGDAAPAWEWVKWLPHVLDPTTQDGEVPARRVTDSAAAMAELLQPELEARLDRRQRSRGTGPNVGQQLVVFVDGDGLPRGHHLESPDPNVPLIELGVHVISLLDDRAAEPEQVDARLELTQDGAATVTGREIPLFPDLPEEGLADAVSRVLSSLRLTLDESTSHELSGTVGLPEILGVADPAELNVRRTWKPRPLRDLLRVPIGIGETGQPVLLDLKESAHGGMGPHGMVVGATGSGKSEMLRTMVSSLVIGHPPDRLALMLVDFKGGATFASMEHIPHMAGMITNLQDDLTLVDRMRDALYGEMQRRQEILKAAGNLPNVTAYHERIDAGDDLEPLPHLLVIIDEFSELLTAKPDFAELFVAIGRIGRSIGVHLLLATQKLEMGKIRGLESHLSYRISLRTFSEQESRDAIGVADAYHLPPEPGSGYLKVDTTVFDRFKAALVSAPYVPPSAGPSSSTVPVVPYLAVNGLGAWLEEQAAAADAAEAEAEEKQLATDRAVLDVLCDQIVAADAPAVRPVWLEPLPEILSLDRAQEIDEPDKGATVEAIMGLVDEPAKQDQYPLEWDFAGSGSNLIISGAPLSGKSTLIRTTVTSLALR